MKLEQKNKIIEKYGAHTINDVFMKFIKGKSVQHLAEKAGFKDKEVEDFLRVAFYTLDAIIVDQREEIEGDEILLRSALAMLPDETRKKLIEAAKSKK